MAECWGTAQEGARAGIMLEAYEVTREQGAVLATEGDLQEREVGLRQGVSGPPLVRGLQRALGQGSNRQVGPSQVTWVTPPHGSQHSSLTHTLPGFLGAQASWGGQEGQPEREHAQGKRERMQADGASQTGEGPLRGTAART